ncbi:hypothetical protein Hanom_Chr13g01214771 [Helianthus anomalus]
MLKAIKSEPLITDFTSILDTIKQHIKNLSLSEPQFPPELQAYRRSFYVPFYHSPTSPQTTRSSSAGLASRRRFGVHRRHHRNHTEKNPQLAGVHYIAPCTSPEFKVRIGVSWTSPENPSLLLFGIASAYDSTSIIFVIFLAFIIYL